MFRTLLAATALTTIVSGAFAATYTVTVTNNLEEELLAPILITNSANDGHIFSDGYVTAEAEAQILTGDPGMLAARIGSDAMVGHGMDGPPGVLLAPGKSVTFDIMTEATSVRVLSMIAPTIAPDNYVSNVVDLQSGQHVTADLVHYDIGHDENTKMRMRVGADHGAMGDTMTDGDTMAGDADTMKGVSMSMAAVEIEFVRK